MIKNVVLITGSSAGIGLACANQLHGAGWTVVGASRRGTSGAAWQGITMDVDDDEAVKDGVARVMDEHGQLDAIVTCAGWGLAGAAETTSIDEAKAQLDTNFWGTVRVINAALPIFREHGGGRVVVMSSIGGLIGLPFQSFYSASKFALEGYAESLAYEVAPFNIRVTLVEPGNFRTDFTQSRRVPDTPDNDPYRAAREKAISKMERDEATGADPAEVARVVADVLNSSRPPRRVSVGKIDERIGLVAKRLLPFKLFERSAKHGLGI
jgi:NAD(P)-dependent dehydrogenase (short-subunit alcohol dehydrogenase family)